MGHYQWGPAALLPPQAKSMRASEVQLPFARGAGCPNSAIHLGHRPRTRVLNTRWPWGSSSPTTNMATSQVTTWDKGMTEREGVRWHQMWPQKEGQRGRHVPGSDVSRDTEAQRSTAIQWSPGLCPQGWFTPGHQHL